MTHKTADHVDAHRTAGLVIESLLQTRRRGQHTVLSPPVWFVPMELILEYPAIDSIRQQRNPMFNSFEKTANIAPYQSLTPKVDLVAKNTPPHPERSDPRR